jgi:nitrate/nitrite transport system substrate-binding protein
MRYWLAPGIDPDTDVKLITIPPPQMVANMRIGNMDGYCVGEPWNARAISDGIGFTATSTQKMWKNHPEKVLGMTLEFAEKNPKTVKAMIMAIIEAAQYIDNMENRSKVAEIIAKEYAQRAGECRPRRMQGKYVWRWTHEQDFDYMKFYRGRGLPWKSTACGFDAAPAVGSSPSRSTTRKWSMRSIGRISTVRPPRR